MANCNHTVGAICNIRLLDFQLHWILDCSWIQIEYKILCFHNHYHSIFEVLSYLHQFAHLEVSKKFICIKMLFLDLTDDAWVSGPDLQRFTKNVLVIKFFYYWSDFDQTLWDCSTHGYYNLTNFSQNRMKNKKLLITKYIFGPCFLSIQDTEM